MSAIWKQFGDQTRAAVYYAMETARANHLAQVGPEELLQAILSFDCDGRRALEAEGIDLKKVSECLLREGDSHCTLDDLMLSPLAKEATDIALAEKSRASALEVNTLMLTLGCLQCAAPRIKEAVERFGISHDKLRQHLRRSESIERESFLKVLKKRIS